MEKIKLLCNVVASAITIIQFLNQKTSERGLK